VGAQRLQLLEGRTGLERRFHNCSGKHAGWLVGCTVAGWDINSYLDLSHPIQRSVCDILADMTGVDPMPAGIDGCGAPAFRGTVRALAHGFHRLTTDQELGRVAWAMTRFGALVADNVRSDGRFGIDWGGPSKVGAEGVFAAGKSGIAVVTKSLDGSRDVAVAAAIEVAALIGALPLGTAEWLEPVAHPPVLGGGVPVGALELLDES
jgi:L-asparaginase II